MSPRNTRTGSDLERLIEPALEQGGYEYRTQVHVGERLGGGRQIVDAVAEGAHQRAILISLKWQQVSGTAEQKVPYEAMCLAEAILNSDGKYSKAYLVLGGAGWKLREYYVKVGLAKHLRHSDLVTIITLEEFVGLANKARL